MDREKQIEEIAKAMCAGCPDNKECMHCLCADWYKAESIYNAGYHKQSEVAMEIIGEILSSHTLDIDGFFTIHESELTELKKKYVEESKNDR